MSLVSILYLYYKHTYRSILLAFLQVLYRPLRELNGIPGAKSLIMCLTGYQRQDRDDVMVLTIYISFFSFA